MTDIKTQFHDSKVKLKPQSWAAFLKSQRRCSWHKKKGSSSKREESNDECNSRLLNTGTPSSLLSHLLPSRLSGKNMSHFTNSHDSSDREINICEHESPSPSDRRADVLRGVSTDSHPDFDETSRGYLSFSSSKSRDNGEESGGKKCTLTLSKSPFPSLPIYSKLYEVQHSSAWHHTSAPETRFCAARQLLSAWDNKLKRLTIYLHAENADLFTFITRTRSSF